MNAHLRMKGVVSPGLLALCIAMAGCDSKDASKSDDASAKEASKSSEDEAPEEKDAAKPSPAAQSLEGTVTFSVDGEAKSFAFIPKAQSRITGIAGTNFRARPDASSKEEFSLVLATFDPGDAELPITLAYEPMELAKSGSPAKIAKSIKPVMSYVAPDGTEYTWFPSVNLESYEDGRLVGTLDDITLKKKGDPESGSVEITDAKFSVTFD